MMNLTTFDDFKNELDNIIKEFVEETSNDDETPTRIKLINNGSGCPGCGISK